MTESGRNEAPPRKLLRVPEAATTLGVSRTTMYGLIAAGRVRAVRFGRSTRLDPQDLDAFIAAHKSRPDGAA